MFKRKHILYAALCLTAALFLGTCAGCAAVDHAVPPEGNASSSYAPEASREGSTSSPVPSRSLPAPEAPEEKNEPDQFQPAPEVPEERDGASPDLPAGPSQEEDVPGPDSETPNEERAPEPARIPARIPAGGVVVPAQAEPVGDEYFDDAAFIGNSLVDGFRMFSGLKNCDYYAKPSMTILGIGDYITQMSSHEYGKVYMLLGINELTYNLDTLMRAYEKAVDRIAGDHPGVIIYVMSVSPVSAKKDASGNVFTMDNVRRFNERLLQFAEDKNCCYIDLCDALGDEDGFLPADATTDGIHFKTSEYKVWLDYLRLHYIPVEEAPEDPGTDPAGVFPAEPETEPVAAPETEPTPETEPGTIE